MKEELSNLKRSQKAIEEEVVKVNIDFVNNSNNNNNKFSQL